MKKYIFAMLVLVTLLGCKEEPPVPPVTTELNGATYELEFSENFNSMDDINENWNVFIDSSITSSLLRVGASYKF